MAVLTLLAIGFSGYAAATLDGVVRDDAGHPLEGATAYLLVAGSHEHTDALGRFHFDEVAAGDTLVVQAVGFTLVREPIAAGVREVAVVLQPLAIDLGAVTIRPGENAAALVTRVDLATQPFTSGQELLRLVPGLMIGQHAGGGKAEQLFLRGFDIDHGTDIAISVDGLPANMVSHAHGQGYADLHWLIAETVERIDYEKGPYDATAGNFATAASIDFRTKRRLRENLLQTEVGQFGYFRALGMANLFDGAAGNAYGAVEYLRNDGPFESPQGLQRVNAFAKANFRLGERTGLTASASHFTSGWDASGQVPQRAVDAGLITRFGAIDDTEGGTTGRSNAQVALHHAVGTEGMLRASAYGSLYDFELFSNFTFFLEDPVNGDQIRQRERRRLGGGEVSYANHFHAFGQELAYTAGLGTRNDATRGSELSHTRNRTETLERIRLGDIAEFNQYAFGELDWTRDRWQVVTGARLDHTTFRYTDRLEGGTVSTGSASSFNPKLRVTYTASEALQVFAKAGSGYHANDTRLITGATALTYMPKARGVDLGATWKPGARAVFTGALWGLWSEQEFVYVGDAGIVEPSGRSRRLGLDLGTRLELYKRFYAGADLNLAYARATDEARGSDRIPLAPPLTATAYLIYDTDEGFSASARLRALGVRPANEDYSITARGYEVLDLGVGYAWRKLSLDLLVDNALNVAWNETQFATETRLAGEVSSVEEIHFTPGVPRSGRVRLGWRF